METLSGLWFDFDDPRPEQISLTDIAGALSQTNRFGGHTPWPYSVAEHACLVRRLVIEDGHPELALAALHHDSHEAYIGDLPTPLKNALERAGVYRPLVASIDLAIGAALDVDALEFHHSAVVAADQLALRWEASVVKPSRGIAGAWAWRELPDVAEDWAPGLDPESAREAFLAAHKASVGPVRC